jgi:hypothetical protein
VSGHYPKLPSGEICQARILHHLQPLQQKNENIQPNQETVDVGRAIARLIVSNGEHGVIW